MLALCTHQPASRRLLDKLPGERGKIAAAAAHPPEGKAEQPMHAWPLLPPPWSKLHAARAPVRRQRHAHS